MKKLVAGMTAATILSLSLWTGTTKVWADSAPGDVIISLGENLTAEQEKALLQELGAPAGVQTVKVSNKEEHEYLGDYIPKSQIGTRALSSSKITMAEKGTGILVSTQHINWVTQEMYVNALATAGVKDAEVVITAPFDVSGTAALTGIIKAYEVSTGEAIPEETKQAANQEMVTTAKLGEELGTEEANNLVTAIKTELAKNEPKNEEEMKEVITTQAESLNIPIDENQTQQLTDLFMKLKELDINWGAVGDQMGEMKDKVENFINSEEGKNFFSSVGQFIKDVFEAIANFFGAIFNKEEETTTP